MFKSCFMKRIELTEMELQMLKLNVAREFYPLVASPEEVKAMNSVIKKAEDLMEELDAYDELDESLMEWFLEKYNNQEE